MYGCEKCNALKINSVVTFEWLTWTWQVSSHQLWQTSKWRLWLHGIKKLQSRILAPLFYSLVKTVTHLGLTNDCQCDSGGKCMIPWNHWHVHRGLESRFPGKWILFWSVKIQRKTKSCAVDALSGCSISGKQNPVLLMHYLAVAYLENKILCCWCIIWL